MRSALAKGLEISEDTIDIDYESKMVTINSDPAVTKDAIAKALEASNKYGVAN